MEIGNSLNTSFSGDYVFLVQVDELMEFQSPSNLFQVWQISLVINCICGFLTLFGAIYLLYSTARQNEIVPVYIINLIASELVHLSAMIAMTAAPNSEHVVSGLIYRFGEMASVAFMVCVAFERYLVIAHPMWYHISQKVKISLGVSVLVWGIAITVFLPTCLCGQEAVIIILTVYHALPIPLFISFLFGVIKGLSAAIHMAPAEKQRIIGILVFPIVFYSGIIIPNIISYYNLDDARLNIVSMILVLYSPLANVILYIFICKGSLDRLCCCKINSNPGAAAKP